MVVGSLVLNTATTIIATRSSIANYPGGQALSLFNKRYAESPNGKSFLLSYVADLKRAHHASARPYREPRSTERRIALSPHSLAPIPPAPGHRPTFYLRRAPMDLQQDGEPHVSRYCVRFFTYARYCREYRPAVSRVIVPCRGY